MSTQIKSPTSDVEKSIYRLRSSARNGIDISNWFKDNLSLLGLIPSENINDVTVTLHHNPLDALHEDIGHNPVVKVALKAAVKDSTKPADIINRMFRHEGTSTSRHTLEHTFDFAFEDWPFLTANLARTILYAPPGSLSPVTRLRGESLLATFVPQHFPGLSWSTLKTLATLDLLPTNAGTFPEDPFIDMLFAYRTDLGAMHIPHVVLPDVLEP